MSFTNPQADYELFVTNARDELKKGGDIEKAKVWATLALGEATLLASPDTRLQVELTGAITVDS